MKGTPLLVLAASCMLLASCSKGPAVNETQATVAGRELQCRVYGAEDAAVAGDVLGSLAEQAGRDWQSLTPGGDSDFAGINELAGSRSGSMSQQSYD
ncbi:MAG: hypothetical protein KC488_08245, partial [Candidatus Cloacimonetes bacterium]|nr:hypothetical protein [Candidatus Cloacimonadota bacterium]